MLNLGSPLSTWPPESTPLPLRLCARCRAFVTIHSLGLRTFFPTSPRGSVAGGINFHSFSFTFTTHLDSSLSVLVLSRRTRHINAPQPGLAERQAIVGHFLPFLSRLRPPEGDRGPFSCSPCACVLSDSPTATRTFLLISSAYHLRSHLEYTASGRAIIDSTFVPHAYSTAPSQIFGNVVLVLVPYLSFHPRTHKWITRPTLQGHG